ncbi:unnamed protein product [Polarella glacialis]|uniref:RAP domain-containing protein n=1 Tax=Polarella glacialis TaxID=89957 RepID=A0A813I7D4_POLGL|nr:unnamed protein product [Polarella glacialis]
MCVSKRASRPSLHLTNEKCCARHASCEAKCKTCVARDSRLWALSDYQPVHGKAAAGLAFLTLPATTHGSASPSVFSRLSSVASSRPEDFETVSSTRWCYAVGAAAVAGAIGASRRSRRTTCARGRQLALLAAEESQATREGGSSRAELFRGLAGSGLAGLSGLAAPAPVLAKGKAEPRVGCPGCSKSEGPVNGSCDVGGTRPAAGEAATFRSPWLNRLEAHTTAGSHGMVNAAAPDNLTPASISRTCVAALSTSPVLAHVSFQAPAQHLQSCCRRPFLQDIELWSAATSAASDLETCGWCWQHMCRPQGNATSCEMASHPPDAPHLRLKLGIASPPAAVDALDFLGVFQLDLNHLADQEAPRRSSQPEAVQLQDLLVQLLVGGSRLGTTTHLLEAAESVAIFAPIGRRSGPEFWEIFAERVGRLTSGSGLDGQQMARVFAACAKWQKRSQGHPEALPCGRAWSHMLRSLGGRLAEPEFLSALELPEIVALARHAALLGEPQVRLAAAIGHRVGGQGPGGDAGGKKRDATAASVLSPQDLIDLIGAAGRLGGRLHMMTRALADRLELSMAELERIAEGLEPHTPELPTSSLVQLCGHLGSLEMFPSKLAAALEAVTPRSCDYSKPLGDCDGGFLPEVLGPLVTSLGQKPDQLDGLGAAALGTILYELYRLDVWDEVVVKAVCQRLRGPCAAALESAIEVGAKSDAAALDWAAGQTPTTSRHDDESEAAEGQQEEQPVLGNWLTLPWKTSANVLLALSYFSVHEPDLQRRLVHELLRARDLPPEAISQLKTFEMAVRVGHAAVTFRDLGGLAARWLFSIRQTASPPEPRSGSAFADDVSASAQSISWHHQPEVEVGPYLLDFAGVHENEGERYRPDGWDDAKPGRSLAKFCVAIEADGPSHFYRPHGRPWHWTSTSKLRHRLLTAMRIRVAHVPYYDWLRLEGLQQKEIYLTDLLLRIQSGDIRSLGLPVSPQQAASPEGGPEGAMGAAGKASEEAARGRKSTKWLHFASENPWTTQAIELSSYGLAELSPTEEPPFGWNWNIEPIGLTTQAYYGKFRLGSEPRILRFLCPASWVVSRPNIDFNGAAGTVQVNDYARGDSATLFVDGANTGKIQDFKKEDFNREIYKALTQKGTNFIQDINIDKVMDGDVPGYKIVEYSYEIYSGAGFTINRSGIASLSQAADTEALEIFWAGVVSGRWQDMGKDLTKIVRSFRCGKVPQGVKIDTLKEFKPLGENFKLDK